MKNFILLFSLLFLIFSASIYAADRTGVKVKCLEGICADIATQKWFDDTKVVFLGGSFTCEDRKMMEKIYNILQIRGIRIGNEGNCRFHKRFAAVKVIQVVDDGKIAKIRYAFPDFYTQNIFDGWILTRFLHDRKEVAKQFIDSK